MSEPPSEKNEIPEDHDAKPDSSTKESEKEPRIRILREKEIPFEEERPPNFSPYYSIKVHGKKKLSKRAEDES